MRRHWYRSSAPPTTLDRPVQRVSPAVSHRRAQYFLYLPAELLLAVRLGQELHVALELALADERPLEITGGEQHLETGTDFHRLGREGTARQLARHDDVGEQQV